MAGKSGLAWVLANENAARVTTAPSEEGTAFEMWTVAVTSNNTVRRDVLPTTR
jgi:hypothetical protein